MSDVWAQIEAEARGAFAGAGRFPLRAYSEFMPPPYVGIKPYRPDRARFAATFGVSDGDTLDIDEYEQAHDLDPGFDYLAGHWLVELGKLVRGEPHALSHTLLDGNPAWPSELVEAAHAGRLAGRPLVLVCALALSRTQDDKGNDRWTLFGASHDGPGAALWQSADERQLEELVHWAGASAPWQVLAAPDELPASLQGRLLRMTELARTRTLVTFRPFAELPAEIRSAYLAGTLTLLPSPASLIFHAHPRYRVLAGQLPHAMQIPLLHLFPRVEKGCAIRIPQSGWLDEQLSDGHTVHHGHRVVSHVVRTHRWQRVARDADIHGAGAYSDPVSVALFSTTPEAVSLYNKPLARNVQIWTEDYRLLLDGPRAGRDAIRHAAAVVGAGGRFGYRMIYPPMRAGPRELFWHVPLVTRDGAGRLSSSPPGYVTAEMEGRPLLTLRPQLLARPDHIAAAQLFPRDEGHPRYTTSHNSRKLLDTRALLGRNLAPAHARALLHVARTSTLDDWLEALPEHARDRGAGTRLLASLRKQIGADDDLGPPFVLDRLATREVEEQIWHTIAHLAHGAFRQKNDADGIRVNRGKHGGQAARAAHVTWHERRDLEALGDHLHARYRALIEAHGMTGRAEVVDHVFRWETDFEFPWMDGWTTNQQAPRERNVVLMVPGRDRSQAVIMGDHYDTAYMEDVYYEARGGDQLRAPACGADDNHSATTALLLAAEQLLPLARTGRLACDVWLVHLTGEEFPSDCLGARALGQALVERRLEFIGEDGSRRDVSLVDVVAAYILDMIGHNTERDRDVFQIAPGEGAASTRLAHLAHRANLRWNRLAHERNQWPGRCGAGRAHRMPDGTTPPPVFAHLPLHGEIRAEWEPRSALFNTDGAILSDLGVPVVLFMENYDISRSGYHDTQDTMANIDLDYCAALTAIAIETVVETACVPTLTL